MTGSLRIGRDALFALRLLCSHSAMNAWQLHRSRRSHRLPFAESRPWGTSVNGERPADNECEGKDLSRERKHPCPPNPGNTNVNIETSRHWFLHSLGGRDSVMLDILHTTTLAMSRARVNTYDFSSSECTHTCLLGYFTGKIRETVWAKGHADWLRMFWRPAPPSAWNLITPSTQRNRIPLPLSCGSFPNRDRKEPLLCVCVYA